MKVIFITYGDEGFEKTKKRICREAKKTGVFDEVYAYGPENLPDALVSSEVFKIRRGGGLWSWKPWLILSTMMSHDEGDIIVYCDAGCTLSQSSEWNRYLGHLLTSDIIVQRLLQPTDKWTRKELIAYFSDNGPRWIKDCQYLSGVLFFKNTPFSRQLVREWKTIMIGYPDLAADVPVDQLHLQHSTFIESRHDQSVLSALIYKYLSNPKTQHLIYTQWEHVEFYDLFFKQAIRATRLRTGENETILMKVIAVRRRLLVDLILRPFYYSILHWWYSL